MIDQRFLGYVRVDNMLDPRLERVTLANGKMEVVLAEHHDERLAMQFRGVRSMKSHHPEGMAVHSVGEFKEASSLRRFVFVNWGGDDAALEVVAEEVRITEQA